MSATDLFVNFFVALFALIDPIGNVPLFAAATLGAAAAGRRMVAVYIGLFVAAFLIFFFFTGVGLLAFFGISMPAFRIAGGIILFILGLGVAVISAVSLVLVAVFWAAPLISRVLGRIGMSIVVRVLGLILCALAVQFVLIGVGDATRGLIRADAKAPYAEHR